MVVRAQQRSTWLVLASLGASAGYAGFAATRARPTQAKRLDVAHAVPPHVTPRESENPLQPKSVYSRPPRVPSEYDLNLGTAIDTLRRDYPKLFVEKPDLSIFTPTVELFDPSGKRLQVSPPSPPSPPPPHPPTHATPPLTTSPHPSPPLPTILQGVSQYERIFDMLRFLRRTTMQDAELTYRIVVHEGTIRVRWCAKMHVRDPALGFTSLNVIDGVSVYELDSKGKIRKHKIETIVMAKPDGLMQPVNLGLLWPTHAQQVPEMAIPFFRLLDEALAERTPSTQPGLMPFLGKPRMGASRAGYPQATLSSPETPMQRAAREREEDAEKARRLADLRAPREETESGGGGWNPFANAFKKPQECETSYDCDAPMVCCDLIVASVCCSGGQRSNNQEGQMQGQLIPIPVEVDKPLPGDPRGGSTPPQYPNGF